MNNTEHSKKSIPRIDEKKTKLALERALEKYREYLITLPSFKTPSVTPSYSITPVSNTNEFNSKTENVAIERADYEIARTNYMNKIISAVSTLKEQERKIIIERFLLEDVYYDTEIMAALHVSQRRYYKLKWQAMLRLAFALKIEVYHNKALRGVGAS